MPKARQRAEVTLVVAAEAMDSSVAGTLVERVALADLLSTARRDVPAAASRAREILARMHEHVLSEQLDDGSFAPRGAIHGRFACPSDAEHDTTTATWLS